MKDKWINSLKKENVIVDENQESRIRDRFDDWEARYNKITGGKRYSMQAFRQDVRVLLSGPYERIHGRGEYHRKFKSDSKGFKKLYG
jgi:hypothetical protein